MSNLEDQVRLWLLRQDQIGGPLAALEERIYQPHTIGNNAQRGGGYDWIVVFFTSNRPFVVTVEQDCIPNPPGGLWGCATVVNATLQTSGLWAAAFKQAVRSEYVRVIIRDTSGLAHSMLRGLVYALPCTSAAGSPDQPTTVNVHLTEGHNGATGQFNVTNIAAIGIPQNANRRQVTFRNMSRSPMYFGYNGAITPANAYPVLPGESYTISDTDAAIWFISTVVGPLDLRYEEQQE